MAKEQGRRKERTGVVLSDKMHKSRVIGVAWSQPHPLYQRRVRRITRFKAHDEANATRVGDRVRIVETRPLSKEKRWRIVEVLERAEVIEIRPEEVDTTLLKELEEKAEAAPSVAAAPAAPVAEAPAAPVAVPEAEGKPKRARKAPAEQPQAAAEQPAPEAEGKPKKARKAPAEQPQAAAEQPAPEAEAEPKAPRARRRKPAAPETPGEPGATEQGA